MVQFPAAKNKTVDPFAPLTVHTEAVCEVYAMARPDEAAERSPKLPAVSRVSTSGANVIVCDALSTEKDWVTVTAAANTPLPSWLASIAHWPAPISVTVLPDTAHIFGVVDESDTVRPEDAVALSVNGKVPKGRLPIAEKVIDCAVKGGVVANTAEL